MLLMLSTHAYAGCGNINDGVKPSADDQSGVVRPIERPMLARNIRVSRLDRR